MFYTTFTTSLSPMTLVGDTEGLTRLHFGAASLSDGSHRNDAFFAEARQQIEAYLAGERQTFNLALNLAGTDFQRRVWRELQKIPYGETRTYGEIAAAIGSPKAARGVGMANNRNPLPLLVPCHRVIGADGSLTGFAAGLAIKEKLLRLERGIAIS